MEIACLTEYGQCFIDEIWLLYFCVCLSGICVAKEKQNRDTLNPFFNVHFSLLYPQCFVFSDVFNNLEYFQGWLLKFQKSSFFHDIDVVPGIPQMCEFSLFMAVITFFLYVIEIWHANVSSTPNFKVSLVSLGLIEYLWTQRMQRKYALLSEDERGCVCLLLKED